MKSEVSLTELYNEVCESITLLVRENESLRKEIHHLKELSESSSRSEIENLKAEIESLHDTVQELENGKKTYEEKFHTILKILRGASGSVPIEVKSVQAPKNSAKPEVRQETKMETILPSREEAQEDVVHAAGEVKDEAPPPRRGPPPEKPHEPKPASAVKAESKASVDASYKEDDPFSDEGEFQDDDDFFKSLTSKTNE
ncbi:MAG: hypothetical protein JNM63_17090 [Spirochaetia bacterium]|nr:hypothetical protein [Spirochaetia bacterium]